MDHKALIEKAIYTLLGLIGTILTKYISDLEQSRITTRLEYQEIHLRDLDEENDIFYRIEKELANYERRISRLESRR